jgi:hypothetical protein
MAYGCKKAPHILDTATEFDEEDVIYECGHREKRGDLACRLLVELVGEKPPFCLSGASLALSWRDGVTSFMVIATDGRSTVTLPMDRSNLN